jgi:hypothetical protein
VRHENPYTKFSTAALERMLPDMVAGSKSEQQARFELEYRKAHVRDTQTMTLFTAAELEKTKAR